MDFQSIAFGLVSGFAGWMLTEFLAKPFRKGIDLVSEARITLIIFGEVGARYRNAGMGVVQVEIPEKQKSGFSEPKRRFERSERDYQPSQKLSL